jgi:hypothetical protein
LYIRLLKVSRRFDTIMETDFHIMGMASVSWEEFEYDQICE